MLKLALLLIAACPPVFAANLAVNLSGTTNQAFDNKLQDTDVQVARFVIQAGGGDVAVDAIVLHVSNAAAPFAFTGVRLFYDADGNSTFDPSEELSTVQAVSGGAVTFTESFTAVNGLSRELQVRVNIGTDVSTYGEGFQFRIDAATSIVLPGGSPDTVSGTFPVTANAITLRNSLNRLVQGTGNPSAPRSVERGSQNVAALHFAIDSLTPTAPGELVGIDLQAVTLSITVQNNAQTAAVASLSLWQDDGDALFEPGAGEIQIQQRTAADIGKWVPAGNVIGVAFDGTAIAVLPSINVGQARVFWVSVSFVAGSECVAEVSVNRANVQGSLGAGADFFVTIPTSIGGEVITVTQQPAPPAPDEAQGEGGCAVSAHRQWSALALCLALLSPTAKLRRKRHGSSYT